MYPAGVEDLYKCASSKDKTLHIYLEMWHQLAEAEPEF
jgi:alpha-beta hydrolase superfamily lysophospholipase